MDATYLIKKAFNSTSMKNLVVVAAIPAIGMATRYGMKKFIEYKMAKNTAKESDSKSYQTCSQNEEEQAGDGFSDTKKSFEAEEQTVNFTFGTGNAPEQEEQTVNFTFGTGGSLDDDKGKKDRWIMDDLFYGHKYRPEHEYRSSVREYGLELGSF